MKKPNAYSIILIFALLHAAVSLAARFIGFHDELALTLLTMTMSVLLSMRKQMGIPFMVIAVILVNFVGIWLGRWIGNIIRTQVLASVPSETAHYLRAPLSTFLTTGVIGLLQLACSNLIRKSRFYKESDTQHPIWLLIAFVVILIVSLVMLPHPENA